LGPGPLTSRSVAPSAFAVQEPHRRARTPYTYTWRWPQFRVPLSWAYRKYQGLHALVSSKALATFSRFTAPRSLFFRLPHTRTWLRQADVRQNAAAEFPSSCFREQARLDGTHAP
jgi:hypothetical protein